MLCEYVDIIGRYYLCSDEQVLACSFKCKKSETDFSKVDIPSAFDVCHLKNKNKGVTYWRFANGKKFDYYKTFNPNEF